MLVQESPLLTKAVQSKSVDDLAGICIGWTSDVDYSQWDAFREGLAIGATRPKRLFLARKDTFNFYFPDSEKKALKKILKLKDC
jgi:hypothetical protein